MFLGIFESPEGYFLLFERDILVFSIAAPRGIRSI